MTIKIKFNNPLQTPAVVVIAYGGVVLSGEATTDEPVVVGSWTLEKESE